MQALEEAQHRLAVGRSQPVRHQFKERALPFVLRSGEVPHPGEGGEEVLRKTEGWDTASHKHHGVDDGEVGAGECQARGEETQSAVDPQHQHELDDKHCDGKMTGGNPGSLQLEVAVGDQQAEDRDT